MQDPDVDITTINYLLYAAAILVAGEVKEGQSQRGTWKDPPWKIRIKKKI